MMRQNIFHIKSTEKVPLDTKKAVLNSPAENLSQKARIFLLKVRIWSKLFFKLSSKQSSGQSESIFDNPTEEPSPVGQIVFAGGPKKYQLLFLEKFYASPERSSGDEVCSLDNPAETFLQKVQCSLLKTGNW